MQKSTPHSIFYIEFLRFIAAIAVIAIHVLGPFRHLYGQIPEIEWLAAAGINSVTRWAVPVFMMISGALLLSSDRAFDCGHYLSKRLSKVAVPFVGWTIIYALMTGFMVGELFTGQWQAGEALRALFESPNNPTWYHLWFFYDFIPLYFVIPFAIPLLKKASPEMVKLMLFAWAVLFLMNWLKVETFLRENIVLYTGYLILGWYLFNRDNRPQLKLWVIAGISMLAFNFIGTWILALQTGAYSSFFMGYKTLNTAVIGAMLFVLAQCYADKIQGKLRDFIHIVSKYSLGIYLLHPLLLIPVRTIDNGFYDLFFSNWLAIPLLTFITLVVSLLLTMLLVKIPGVRRLVP